MNFDDTTQEAAFRQEARAWLDANAPLKQHPRDVWRATGSGEQSALAAAKEWQQKKQQSGWACLQWPKAYGGRESTPMERVIWGQEESRYKVPRGFFDIGQGMCGPVLMTYATEEQKQRYLPPMASGEDIWCQLFSEPSAGSDVAGLRSRAVRDGDDWIINGQKIWTSGAHYSDYGILVVRHDPDLPKHKGLTFFFLDMKSPGIETRPIRQISGSSNFNEVYFEDVRIPDSQRLGAVGDGWKVALTTLMNERLAVGDAPGPDFDEAFALAKEQKMAEGYAIEDSAVRRDLANWYVQMTGLKYTKYRTISALSRGATPGPEASITKVVSASKLQNIGSFGIEARGMAGMLMHDDADEGRDIFHQGYLGAPGLRIAGGTDEILRNILAERVLGLPQEPRADKGVPFNKIPGNS
ncbi:MAG: acyl-CoA dehydrogenase family protein [Gammaproteobacteria bacterium]